MKSRAREIMAQFHGRLVHARRVRVLAEKVARLVPPGSRLLDVGSGDGRFARLLAENQPGLRVEGLEVIVRPGTAIPTRSFDGVHIPHPDGAFDAVTLIDVLHHAADAERLLAEASRVASRCVILKDHYRKGFAAGATLRLMDWWANSPHGVALPYRYLTEAEWDSLFRRLRLEADELLTRLDLYPRALGWAFERSLHFLIRLRPARRA